MGGAAAMTRTVLPLVIGFNAARGFVGGAAEELSWKFGVLFCFNAARGFVGGAAGFYHGIRC